MEILLIKEVARRLKISEATLYRWIAESRAGTGSFPLPISERGRTLRWNSDDINAWCQSQAKSDVKVSARRTKTTAKERSQRQEALSKAMERHGLGGKEK